MNIIKPGLVSAAIILLSASYAANARPADAPLSAAAGIDVVDTRPENPDLTKRDPIAVIYDDNKAESRPEILQAPNPNDRIYSSAMVEQKAYFPGGDKALYDWLCQNMQYPAEAAAEGIQGRVIVQFVIEKDGSITNVKVARGKHPALDAEAVRLTNLMPKWQPGRNNGIIVRTSYLLPITFRLNNE